MELFSSPEPEQPILFDNVNEQTKASPYTAQTDNNTAILGGLAMARINGMSDQSLEARHEFASSLISQGKEAKLRDTIVSGKDAQEASYLRQVQTESLRGQNNAPLGPLVERELAGPQNKPESALEVEGVSEIQDQANADPNQAWLMSQMKDHTALDLTRDHAAKMMIFNREMSSLDKQRQDQGLWGNVSDFFATPFRGITSALSLPGKAKNGVDVIGNKLQAEVSSLWDPSVSVDDFATKLLPATLDNIKNHSGFFTPSLTQQTETLSQMYGVRQGDVAKLYGSSALDATMIPPGMMAKIIRSPLKLAMMMGDRAGATKAAATTILNDAARLEHPAGEIVPGVDAVAESLPSSIVPNTTDLVSPYVKASADISQAIADMQEQANGIHIIRTQRLEPAQEAEAVEKFKATLENKYNGDQIYDIQTRAPFTTNPGKIAEEHAADVAAIEQEAMGGKSEPIPNRRFNTEEQKSFQVSKAEDTGIQSVDVFLGRKFGKGGFVTEAGARAQAKARGLADFEIVDNADGQKFIKVRHDVPEDKVSTPFLTDDNMPRVWNWRQFSSGPHTFLNDVLNRTRSLQTFQQSAIKEQLFKPILANITALSAPESKTLGKILVKGEQDQKWYNLSELSMHWEREHGSPLTDKQALAYYSAKEANDQVWKIFNANVYINKARRGVVSGSAENKLRGFSTGYRNMIEHDKPDFSKLRRVFDLEDGHTELDSAALQKKFDTGNYRVLEIEGEFDYGGQPVKYVLAHKRSSTVGSLERTQLGYVSGGSRENVSHYFVKQVVKGKFDDGSEYFLNPKTHVAARTRIQAKKWADDMERARLAMADDTLTDAQKRAIIEVSPVETMEKWNSLVTSGQIRPETPFEVLADQELPRAMSGLGEEVHKWYDPEASGMEQYYNSKGRMYYSKKGERLLDPDQNLAQILDPYRTLHRAVLNASQAAAFHDYSTKVIEDWSRFVTANGLVEPLKTFDPYNVFFNAKLSKQLLTSPEGRELYAKLNVTRNSHKRLMNMRTDEMTKSEQARARFSEWAQTKGSVGRWAAAKSLDTMSRNPVNALNALVADKWLGFYDPGQFIVQSQTAFGAIATHPVWGSQAAAMNIPLTWVLHNRSESLLDHLATSLKWLHGLDVNEFKHSIRALQGSGIMNVSGEMMQIDRYMNRIGGSALVRGFNTFRTGGRYLFNKAEQLNRLTAYQIAWKDVRTQMPQLDYKSQEFLERIAQKTDALSINMTTASRAYWQKGALAIPTKFMAYQARMLEAILPKQWGGTPTLRGAEKARLAASQILMYGAGGLPILGMISNFAAQKYGEATGQPLDKDTYRTISKGLWDSLVYNTTGLETDFSARASTGTAWDNIVNSLTHPGFKSFLEIWTGATGEASSDAIDLVSKFVTYAQAEQINPASKEDWGFFGTEILQQVAVGRRATKAYFIHELGYLRDPKTGQKMFDTPKLAEYAALLGVPLVDPETGISEAQKFHLQQDIDTNDQMINDMAKMIAQNRNNAFTALHDGDQKMYDYYLRKASGLTDIFKDRPYLLSKVVQQADKYVSYTDGYRRLKSQYEEQHGVAPPGGQ